jgi:glutamate-ammonia-ligase adenylyltransferase
MAKMAVRGHNVKLGRGGIREIEFFVQTQQLIAGGRCATSCAGRETVAMLGELNLQSANWITPEVRDANEPTQAYWFLRDVEHRNPDGGATNRPT